MAIRMNRGNGWSFAERDQHATLANEPANASDMRAFVCDFLEAAKVPTHVIDEILMAVGEVVANACRHGRALAGNGKVDLFCDRNDKVVSIRVTDDGPGFDVAAVFDAGVPHVLYEGGRGFFLMRQLMDKVDVQSGPTGTVVTLQRALPDR
jgi:anti-sigma regulatory factor (Ser/Thr protein kinase)